MERLDGAFPRRGQLWKLLDGKSLLVLQHDLLNRELRTTSGVVVTRFRQRAPAPLRVRLPADTWGAATDYWVKVPLLRTVAQTELDSFLGEASGENMKEVESALLLVLDLERNGG